MPLYEFFCDKCQKEVSLTLSMQERQTGHPACPECGNRELRPLVGPFFSKTSRKS
jgi:putative FmdB family regulatory protein